MLGKEILTAVKSNNLKYQELSILDRFYTIINYVSSELINNKQKIIDRLNAVFRDPTTVTSFLDHICDGLGWMPYSVALDKLAVYYKKETDRCKYAPEVYFYKIAQKIVDAKINNKAFAYQTSDFIIDDFIQNKVPLVIFCSDGQVTIGDEFKDIGKYI